MLSKYISEPFHEDSKVALEYPESVKSDFPLASLSVGDISITPEIPRPKPPVGLIGDTIVADMGVSIHIGPEPCGALGNSAVHVLSLGRVNYRNSKLGEGSHINHGWIGGKLKGIVGNIKESIFEESYLLVRFED